ncbi:Methylenetetrahydrofolate--tRNA-(uracil-5-)-methyltransferase TrmFO [Fundidesulfovibrio magnetotacticus]|uniref:Methylenetetrahydrofolate--tRNA-(uracil-5-)-methyltransferase TrmFO n=1 Tax=Fundidesulfovibrio magnetotacticus TaxID=2730080 RepID=A0A6V8LW15_9BACT|nr:methylenetetrahydrofolate--tRNA-(uracil(54)-C(5))-methyltransferase (FADH(2)-oxidizing) TrmFO [Fundidesulfovibrio magnetotacticus]GFK94791.1 Methylenetetrahydrofolate--tRNA-(uracil-5-)-methyltransferase TrmFO [Fundidesulfovibrio magnetotacticus]
MASRYAVIGGGLAGCECALALARAGKASTLFEMRPGRMTPAHSGAGLGELVCSNSLRSDDPESAVGLLKREMERLGSVVLEAARAVSVPAGKALAVDRELFTARLTAAVEAEPLVSVTRREVESLDDPALQGFDHVVVAAGPLASQALSESLAAAIGGESLYFHDAIAPIVFAHSIDREKVFSQSRWEEGEGDYLNCPMEKDEYTAFHQALLDGERVVPREFEKELHFEGCMPVEALADRGFKTLVFGPMKPVGLTDPRTGRRPYAVVQLRPENREATCYNLVGFQTKLKYPEQERIFRMIPGLERAEFARLGSIHRNTYVNAPKVLSPVLELLARPGVFLAGQITGVEGYVESAACGLWLGHHLGRGLTLPPGETCLGALLAHLRRPVKKFQPSNVNYGLTPELTERAKKDSRKALYARRAREAWEAWEQTAG